jgi:hypothetical protein
MITAKWRDEIDILDPMRRFHTATKGACHGAEGGRTKLRRTRATFVQTARCTLEKRRPEASLCRNRQKMIPPWDPIFGAARMEGMLGTALPKSILFT